MSSLISPLKSIINAFLTGSSSSTSRKGCYPLTLDKGGAKGSKKQNDKKVLTKGRRSGKLYIDP